MNKLVIPVRKIEVDYPSSWDEIGEKHARRIGEILYLCQTGKLDFDMARKLAIDEFLNRVNKPIKPALADESLTYWANESLLADSVDFLFKHETDKKGVESVQINPKFIINPVPKVRIGLWSYKGPADLLADLTIMEWKEATWRIGAFSKTQEERYLNELFAVLYFRKKVVSSRQINRARRVPVGLKFMVYLFFMGCMNWIREEPVEIDGEEIDFSCLFPKEGEGNHSKSDDHTGLAGILFQMAESGVFGNMEQTSKVSMWDVFLRLYQIHHQIKSMKI